jgi:DNA-binding NtrC family response regulator
MLPWYKGGDVRSNPTKAMSDHILVVDDEPGSREGLRRLLQAWGYEAETAAPGERPWPGSTPWVRARSSPTSSCPAWTGCSSSRSCSPTIPCPVIVLTGQGTIEQAVEAVKLGAQDFLEKPVEPAKLKILLERLAGTKELLAENRRLRAELRERGAFGRLRGGSEKMRACYRQIEQVAPSTLSVLIVGESGTGKELVAQTLHDLSPRRRNEFVALELRGHPPTLSSPRSSGTSAAPSRGRAAQDRLLRDGAPGTLFLDEISEMDELLQAKLLRVLQEQKFRRVGRAAR